MINFSDIMIPGNVKSNPKSVPCDRRERNTDRRRRGIGIKVDNQYGFLERLPEDDKAETEVTVPGASNTDWYTTREIDGAVNHCASVMAANTYAALNSKMEGDRSGLLASAYNAIGNGPILRGVHRAHSFLVSQNVPVGIWPALTISAVKAQLKRGRPCAMLVLGPTFKSWHWIVAFGYVETEKGNTYLEIADGWHKNAHYFRNRCGSRMIFAASFCPRKQA